MCSRSEERERASRAYGNGEIACNVPAMGPRTTRQMPLQSKLCPFCRGLNSADERRCYRCGRPLPGPLASGLIGFFQNTFTGDAAVTRLFLGLCILVFALCMISDRRLR